MRKGGVQWLTIFGVVALLAAWPLWHVVRIDYSGCFRSCLDPPTYLPFGWLAGALTVAGVFALVLVAVLLLLGVVIAAVRQDRRERAAK